MLRVTAIPYTLRFKRPAATSRGALHARQVVFLRAERDGIVGWGECGPAPGLSPDDRPDYFDQVAAVCRQINAGTDPASIDLDALPSVAFGLETALLDLAAGGRQILFDTRFSRGEAILPTHGLIWMDKPANLLAQIERKIAGGCSVVKMKIGALPVDEEISLLAEFRRCHPPTAVELRLDANGAWRSIGEALERLHELAEFEPAFVEQPLPVGWWQEMAKVCARSPVAIALDEELIAASTADRRAALLATIRPQHVVLKPTLLGGLAACQAWMADAERLGIGWWINSLLESNIGLNAIAQWTSSLDDQRVHGLGTGQLFANNIPSPLRLDGCGLRLNHDGAWDFAEEEMRVRWGESHWK